MKPCKQDGQNLEQRAVVANLRHSVKQAPPILAEMVAQKKFGVVGRYMIFLRESHFG
jgi:hypothetical protein